MTFQNSVSAHLNDFLTLILSHLLLTLVLIIHKVFCPSRSQTRNNEDMSLHRRQDHRPCPSLVPVPDYHTAELVENKLPVVTYGSFQKTGKSSNDNHIDDHDDCFCVVCMDRIEASHMVRVPSNCSHAFHIECLDSWIAQGHSTCPLCRSKLLPILYESKKLGLFGTSEDPWRVERMIYLFGEDFVMGP